MRVAWVNTSSSVPSARAENSRLPFDARKNRIAHPAGKAFGQQLVHLRQCLRDLGQDLVNQSFGVGQARLFRHCRLVPRLGSGIVCIS